MNLMRVDDIFEEIVTESENHDDQVDHFLRQVAYDTVEQCSMAG